MKTNHKLTLLAFTAMLSTQAVAADPVLIDTAILQMMTNGFVVGSTGAERIDRGMDDDQIVGGDGADFVNSNTTNYSFGASQTGALSASASPASSLTTDLNTEVARAASPVGLPSMSTAGDGWTLTGTKMYVIDGHTATLIIVAARTAKGVSLCAQAG